MKNNKIFMGFCLLLILTCLTFVICPLSVFAVRNDGNTEVIAHIETTPTEITQPVTDDTSSCVFYDENNVATGDRINISVIISFILLIISVLTIYVCNKINRQYGSNDCNYYN